MARTISEIKESIAADFMRNDVVAEKYGFERGADFYTIFSKMSIFSKLFDIFATASWVIETLFDSHKAEVNERVDQIMPHRPKWYRDMVLRFMKDKVLIPDTDEYDTTAMTEPDIAAARVVKHAVATENADSSILTIKVAGEEGGTRTRLDAQTETQLLAYIREVKDAGVKIALVNMNADTFDCDVDIYYDPMLIPEEVEAACREAIESYIENLPFNGEYTNMALIDCLQEVEGVRIPELKGASTSPAGDTAVVEIDARYIPLAGYFAAGDIKLNMKAQ
jgi:hypothetical protein